MVASSRIPTHKLCEVRPDESPRQFSDGSGLTQVSAGFHEHLSDFDGQVGVSGLGGGGGGGGSGGDSGGGWAGGGGGGGAGGSGGRPGRPAPDSALSSFPVFLQ